MEGRMRTETLCIFAAIFNFNKKIENTVESVPVNCSNSSLWEVESFQFKSDPFLEEEIEEQVVKEIEFPSEINNKSNFIIMLHNHYF